MKDGRGFRQPWPHDTSLARYLNETRYLAQLEAGGTPAHPKSWNPAT